MEQDDPGTHGLPEDVLCSESGQAERKKEGKKGEEGHTDRNA